MMPKIPTRWLARTVPLIGVLLICKAEVPILRTGSAFSMGVVVAESGFQLSGIEPRALQRLADSGRTSTQWVCPECGSWIAGPARDGLVRVRAGTLDDTSRLKPTRHIWVRSKQPWVVFGDGDEIFEKAAPA